MTGPVLTTLLDRIPTRSNLALRGLPVGSNTYCPFCNSGTETTAHLFLHCATTTKVWYAIARWIGNSLILPPSLSHAFATMVGCGVGKRGCPGSGLLGAWPKALVSCMNGGGTQVTVSPSDGSSVCFASLMLGLAAGLLLLLLSILSSVLWFSVFSWIVFWIVEFGPIFVFWFWVIGPSLCTGLLNL
ncbi:cytochrome p450 [Trifolium pratense]|uniref:Cytochrome p450 n=1 Tax=Trifolium pratense TaxID=57577 RepID=A0A2K3MQ99_TRIPR|nr:cytochrome p450 [Trifolium pratense]